MSKLFLVKLDENIMGFKRQPLGLIKGLEKDAGKAMEGQMEQLHQDCEG